jgi:uncharacterized protein involved in outer membrane biogenesis
MRRLLLIVAATIALLIVAAAGGLYWFFSGDGMRRALEQQATAFLGQPVTIASARGQLFPRPGIGLEGIEVGKPAQLTLASVDLSTDLRALLSRRIEDARVVIADSTIRMPLPFSMPEDSPGTQGTAAPGGVTVVSVGEIWLRDVRIVSRGREVRVNAESSLNGNHFTLHRFTAESGSTSLQAEGEADLEPRVDAKLKARANKVDLDELLALADAFTPPPSKSQRRSSSPSTMKVAAQIDADSAVAAGVQITKFKAAMTMDGDRIALSPMTFGLFGGTYEGSLNGRLGDNLAVTLQSRLKNLDVAQLAAFGGSPDTITGTLAAEGTFSAQGADTSTALANANGKGSASIVSGTIKRLDLVRTVVLFFGRPAPDTAAATDQFERIDTTFSLARQVVRADTFAMHSRDADVAGAASLALESGALDGTVDLTLSEELSQQAGTDLARFTREENRVVLPAKLGGTLQQPSITINALAAVRRGIQNEIQERLKGLFGR